MQLKIDSRKTGEKNQSTLHRLGGFTLRSKQTGRRQGKRAGGGK